MKISIERDREDVPRRRDLLFLPIERMLRRFASGLRKVVVTMRDDRGGDKGRTQVVCDVRVEDESGQHYDVSRRATREPQALDRALRDLAEDLEHRTSQSEK